MNLKKLLLGILSGVVILFLSACSQAPEQKVKDEEVSVPNVVDNTEASSQKELNEILEKTIPDFNDHFEANDEGLEAFIRQVEEFPPLVDLSMIEKIRERGKFYFTEEQMRRLNTALDETTAL